MQDASFERYGGKGRGERRVRLADEAISEFAGNDRTLSNARGLLYGQSVGEQAVRWVLPRTDTSSFPRGGYGGFTRCRYLSHCVGRGGSARLWRFVDICRIMSDEGRARLWCFCR